MIKSTETTPITLEERVADLRTNLIASPAGRSTLMELFPAKMVHANQSIVDFSDWGQKTSSWPEED